MEQAQGYNHSSQSPTEKLKGAEDEQPALPAMSLEAEASSPSAPPIAASEPPPSQEPKSAAIMQLQQELEVLPNVEQKLQAVITFMENILAQPATPHFKTFWEARQLCLELFKDVTIEKNARFTLWMKYQELSKEARHLKEIIDEQGKFAAEQIGIAIEAIEKDMAHFDSALQGMATNAFPPIDPAYMAQVERYDSLQKQISWLNMQANHLNTLRDELIKTGMRIRDKNKFFRRLSTIGDQIFPRRKELIQQISSQFSQDIANFVEKYFGPRPLRESHFNLREAIKTLQAFTKMIGINAQTFSQTRQQLSKCWDQLKEQEQKRKQEFLENKVQWDEHAQQINQKIEQVEADLKAHKLTPQQVNHALEEVVQMMRQLKVGANHLKILRQKLNAIHQPILDELRKQQEEQQSKAQEVNQRKKQAVQQLRHQLEQALQEAEQQSIEEVQAVLALLTSQLGALGLQRQEKVELERLLHKLQHRLIEKQDQVRFTLSSEEAQNLEHIQKLLAERQQQRRELKAQIEGFRHKAGTSGQDFGQALHNNEQMIIAKKRLEKIDESVEELQQQISQLLQR